MAYITKVEYDTLNPNNDLDENEFNIYSEAASVIIDRLSISRIPSLGGLDVFSAYTQDKVKRAAAAQIDAIDAQGGMDALTGNPTAIVGSVGIGKYSESNSGKSGAGKGIQLIDSIPVSPLIRMYLQPTGLLYRTLNTIERLSDFR